MFHSHLDKALFQEKWGEIDEEKRNKEILTWVNSDFDKVQRIFMVDHWEVDTPE